MVYSIRVKKGEMGMKPQRLRPECINCFLHRYLQMAPEGTDIETQLEYMQRVLQVVAEAKKEMSAPVLIDQINDIRSEMFGYRCDNLELRTYFNKLVLEKEEELISHIQKAENPMKLAIKYAMIGNYIDFGAMNNVSEEQLNQFLAEADEKDVNQAAYEELLTDLGKASRLVYLTDNCGEIVFDKLLIQQIKEQFSNLSVCAIVRGGDILNDATMEDARQVGLDKLVTVMGNGNKIAGTWLPSLSKEATATIDSADVIIAKGQANFETLRKCGKNIYYLFMCKCEMFAREFEVPRYTGIIVNDKNLTIR